MGSVRVEYSAFPAWFEAFAVSPTGIFLAFAIVIGAGLLASHKS